MRRALLLLLLVGATLEASPATSAFVGNVRVDLTHVDAGRAFSKLELIRRAMQRSKARAATLSVARNAGRSGGVTRPVRPAVHPSGDFEYVLDLAIGTPPQPVSALLDTGSDLIWTQCSTCSRCLAQPDPLFVPDTSSSYKPMPCSGELCAAIRHRSCLQNSCSYQYSYGDGTTSLGIYATEHFTFTSSGEKIVLPLGFGCGLMNVGSLNNGSGIVGFGRDKLSLVSQLAIHRFSYCLTPYTSNKKSTLLFGSLAGLYNGVPGPVQTTPLLRSRQNPTFYYVAFTGITVGTERLHIPESAFALKADGSGGVIVDSGTAFTLFPQAVVEEVEKAFQAHLKLPFANDSSQDYGACFAVPAGKRLSQVPVPRLMFHLRDAYLDLPRRNYIVNDRSKGNVCLLLSGSGDDGSTIGNFVQQDMRVLYDLQKESLSFAPAQC